MKLFHNADINDLNSIVKEGLLPMSITHNNNWSSYKRSDNSRDVVYLFNPTGRQNSFIQYGAALIEVDVNSATKSEMFERDVNKGKYEEYIIDRVPADKIGKIYIPRIFKDKVMNPGPIFNAPNEDVLSKVVWCDIDGEYMGADVDDFTPMNDDVKNILQNTAGAFVINDLYFRGCDPRTRSVICVYNIIYHIEEA